MKERLKLKISMNFLIVVLCSSFIIGLCVFIVVFFSNKDIEQATPSILEEQSLYLDYALGNKAPRIINDNIDFTLSVNDLNLRMGEDKKIYFVISIDKEHDLEDKKRIIQSLYGNILYEIEDDTIIKIENDSIIALKKGRTKVIANIYKLISKKRCHKCNVIEDLKIEFNVTVDEVSPVSKT